MPLIQGFCGSTSRFASGGLKPTKPAATGLCLSLEGLLVCVFRSVCGSWGTFIQGIAQGLRYLMVWVICKGYICFGPICLPAVQSTRWGWGERLGFLHPKTARQQGLFHAWLKQWSATQVPEYLPAFGGGEGRKEWKAEAMHAGMPEDSGVTSIAKGTVQAFIKPI